MKATLSDFRRHAAQSYLQTAVFVDDKIYQADRGSVNVPKTLARPGLRKPALRSVLQSKVIEAKTLAVAPAKEEPVDFSPQDILTSFAKKKIICGLYQPKKDASVGTNSDAYLLCHAADIVIVDWDLYGDRGRRALELVTNLINQSLVDVPEQLRLVLVYTKELNLEEIANEVYESLAKVVPSGVEPQLDDIGLSLHTINARVAILGKPAKRLAKYQPFEVPEKDLADRAVSEFSRLASGLLQATVLIGLSEIRLNSRKILTKFSSDLDPAFLLHQALLIPREDASDHVLPLLIAEVQSILEDTLPSPVITRALIDDWCEKFWKPGKLPAGIPANKAKEVLRNFCESGKTDGYNKKEVYDLLMSGDGKASNHRLAELFSQRTHYHGSRRHLHLGTILRAADEKTFYLCLQPVCDSVGLKGSRPFVFAGLFTNCDELSKEKAKIVVFHNNAPLELWIERKAYRLKMFDFAPKAGSSVVSSYVGEDGGFLFENAANEKFLWIAQLKADHAQREAEEFGGQLSKVGLTESEWLRTTK